MKNHIQNILSLQQARLISEQLRQNGKATVLTNGCFDLLHIGHIDSLTFAKQQGDILFVGVNCDESVRKLKGEHRPILPIEMRARVLASLRVVDYVVPFSGDTALEVVKSIQPNVYVKGADYDIDSTPEGIEVTQYGGVVRIAELISNISTTSIIQKILNQYCLQGEGNT